ncbi:selenium cofactor biosynthesis protein YqeC [Shewanella sp. UCD-KL12]|uniref:selenium cofactor biosynthesis protein YqeC n=1 Tax=Shewanella sp. UCD-KL12 TaxID=1917163 RepID=UPI000970C209|nr:selenium cofactor biosynthesis protein YqeC [Shewanella sp. UCD-KL12]
MLLDLLLQHKPKQDVISDNKPAYTATRFDNSKKSECRLIALVGGGGKTSCAFTLGEQAKQAGLRVLITTTTKMYRPSLSQCDEMFDLSSTTYSSTDVQASCVSARLNPDQAASNATNNNSASDTYDKNDSPDYHSDTHDSGAAYYVCIGTEAPFLRQYAHDHSLRKSSGIGSEKDSEKYSEKITPLDSPFYIPTKLALTSPKLIFAYHGLANSLDNSAQTTGQTPPQTPVKTKVQGLSIAQVNAIKASGQFDIIFVEADGARSRPIKAPSRHEPCIPTDVDTVIAVTGCEVINKPIIADNIHRWREFSQITATKASDLLDQQVLGQLIAHPEGMFKHTPTGSRRIWLINKIDLATHYSDIAALASALLAQHGSLTGICLASMHSAEPIYDLHLR